jgi:hypothetical protein
MMYLCPTPSHRLPCKNPVNDFSLLDERAQLRRRMAIRQSILEVGAAQLPLYATLDAWNPDASVRLKLLVRTYPYLKYRKRKGKDASG